MKSSPCCSICHLVYDVINLKLCSVCHGAGSEEIASDELTVAISGTTWVFAFLWAYRVRGSMSRSQTVRRIECLSRMTASALHQWVFIIDTAATATGR